MKMTLHHHPPPGTQCHQYHSCDLSNFEPTLKDQQHRREQQQQQQNNNNNNKKHTNNYSNKKNNISAVTYPILERLLPQKQSNFVGQKW